MKAIVRWIVQHLRRDDPVERDRATRAAAAAALPIQDGPSYCPDCYVQPGKQHELSCPEVSFEKFRAFLDGAL